MEHDAFRIGDRFWTATGEWQCTDVGTRTIVAVRIDAKVTADPSWLNGPPYALAERAFDEYDFEGCYPTAADREADLGEHGTPANEPDEPPDLRETVRRLVQLVTAQLDDLRVVRDRLDRKSDA